MPYAMASFFDFDLCKRVLLHPKEAFAELKDKASYRQALLHYGFAAWLFASAAAWSSFFFDPSFTSDGLALGLLAVAFGTFLAVVMLFGFLLVETLVGYEVAVLLGSKADFKTHFFVTTLFMVPITLIGIVFVVVSTIAKTDALDSASNYLSLPYASLAYKEIHGFDTAKIVAWFLISFFILLLAVAILAVGLFAAAPGLFAKA